MVKEEIKAFLGNRRISQAVVAQVTGECTHCTNHAAYLRCAKGMSFCPLCLFSPC